MFIRLQLCFQTKNEKIEAAMKYSSKSHEGAQFITVYSYCMYVLNVASYH